MSRAGAPVNVSSPLTLIIGFSIETSPATVMPMWFSLCGDLVAKMLTKGCFGFCIYLFYLCALICVMIVFKL